RVGEPNRCAIEAGRIKIPEAITLPITMDTADHSPMLFLSCWLIVRKLSFGENDASPVRASPNTAHGYKNVTVRPAAPPRRLLHPRTRRYPIPTRPLCHTSSHRRYR